MNLWFVFVHEYRSKMQTKSNSRLNGNTVVNESGPGQMEMVEAREYLKNNCPSECCVIFFGLFSKKPSSIPSQLSHLDFVRIKSKLFSFRFHTPQ